MTLLLTEPTETQQDEQLDSRERRRGLRVRQMRPVKVFEPTGGKFFGGQTEDISATGLRLELPAFIPIREGQTMSIHVGLNLAGQSLANRRQMLPVRVVWVSRDENRPDVIETGVEFMASIAAQRDAA